MAINKLKGAGNGQVIQAGTSFEVGTQLSITTTFQAYTTITDAIQTQFKSEDDFIISHVNNDADKIFTTNDTIIEGENVIVYIKAASAVTVQILINKGLGMYGV